MNIKFNYAEVENYCTELYNILDELRVVDEDFKSHVMKIKGGSIWAGHASEGFVKKCEKTIKLCNNMEDSLKNAILFIIACSENYEHSESAIMNALKDKLA